MKIFGIGLSRTGTTSLSSALEILGYSSFHFPFVRSLFGKIWIKNHYLKNYEALSDTPVALLYKSLDKKFPGSKFILTIREINSWLTSCSSYTAFQADSEFSIQSSPTANIREKLYGSYYYHEETYRKAYSEHINDVRNYFIDRPQDLLIMDITKGDGWPKLCQFLNKDVPNIPFPNKNKS